MNRDEINKDEKKKAKDKATMKDLAEALKDTRVTEVDLSSPDSQPLKKMKKALSDMQITQVPIPPPNNTINKSQEKPPTRAPRRRK